MKKILATLTVSLLALLALPGHAQAAEPDELPGIDCTVDHAGWNVDFCSIIDCDDNFWAVACGKVPISPDQVGVCSTLNLFGMPVYFSCLLYY